MSPLVTTIDRWAMTAESLALTSAGAAVYRPPGRGEFGGAASGGGCAAVAGLPAGVPASDVHERFRWLITAAKTAALVTGNWPMTPDPVYPGWTCFPRIATRTPGRDVRAVRDARDFAAATARRWGAGERSDDIAVVVSELVTNALRHAAPAPGGAVRRRSVQLGLVHPGPYILCGVADPSTRLPVPAEPDPFAENGRGLHVVSALSDHWGYTTLGEEGKVVWALLAAGCPARR